MRIAICDDNTIILNYIHNKVELFLSNLKFETNMDIKIFSDGKDLLNSLIYDVRCFDILLLDIDMPNISGFKIAKAIRKYNKDILIIFLTSHEHLVYQSFKYSPFRFIRKENIEEEIYEALDSVIQIWNEITGEKYIFDTEDGKIKILSKDIMYIECLNRKIYITTNSKQYKITRGKFSDIIAKFSYKGFIVIHRSCMVNLKYVFGINKCNIMLENKKKLEVSRYRIDEVKRAFVLYEEENDYI